MDSLCSKTRRGGGINRKEIMQIAVMAFAGREERNTGCKDKRNEEQKNMSMSTYGVMLIRSCEEVNCISYLLEDLLYTFWLG